MEINEENAVATTGGVQVETAPAPKKKKKLHNNYIINIVIVLLIAGIVLFLSLKDGFDEVLHSLSTANPYWLSAAFGLAIIIFLLDALILYILARLYTTRYSFSKALAVGLIGTFYNDVTPSSSGGQFAQAYTFKKQGIELASAASILVMHFLIYQTVLVFYGILAFIFRLPLLLQLNPVADINIFNLIKFKLTLIPLSIIGFVINFTVIATILLLSYSKWMHTFVINSVVKIGNKLHFIKHPEKTKQNWMSQIENFRIELRRLQSNIPVTIFLGILFFIKLTVFYSIPYFIGLALNVQTPTFSLINTIYLSGYLQMMTNMIPLPGASGFSEYFFTQVFVEIFGGGAITTAAQLIWRSATFYFGLILGGLVTAFYRSAPAEAGFKTDRKTFLELQRSTYEIRKKTADTMFQTSQLSRKDIESRMKKVRKDLFGKQRRLDRKAAKEKQKTVGLVGSDAEEVSQNPLDTSETRKGEE